jgi:WW domain-binding protein 2
MLNPDRSPVPLPNEMTITTVDAGVDVSLTVPDVPPSSTASAGGSGGRKKYTAMGKAWLTDQRVCWSLSSFHVVWSSTDFKSPPYLACVVLFWQLNS